MEQVEVDVLFVGAGPASLAGAYHLASICGKNNLPKISIAIIEKSKELGDHILSGAVMDPRALRELVPDFLERGAPVDTTVKLDRVMYLTKNGKFVFPIAPPSLRNHGNYILSAGKLTSWLGAEVQKLGVDIFLSTPAAEILYEGPRVSGVRTQAMGLNKLGEKKPNYQPGIDIKAKVTILGEGAFGSLTQLLIEKLDLLKGKHPQSFSLGVKEIWEVKPENHEEGLVIHSLGWPLKFGTFGGGWIYHMKNNLISIGFVVGLDYSDPNLDVQEELQKYKTHPMIAKMLEGGKLIAYGAKTIAEGGYFSMPRLYGDGFLLIGESAGFLNAARLKGIHLAIKSGMLAAETTFEALKKKDFSSAVLSDYEKRFESSWAKKELWRARYFYQFFRQGRLKPDWTSLTHKQGVRPLVNKGPDPLFVTKLSDLYLSGVYHEEDQPSHIIVQDTNICHDRCEAEYGNPCQYFCPANVFEWVDNDQGTDKTLRLSPSNCIHCKTCAIKDPYNIVLWKTPEGGGGPRYKNM